MLSQSFIKPIARWMRETKRVACLSKRSRGKNYGNRIGKAALAAAICSFGRKAIERLN
jgi:hypothetical protein